MLTLFELLIRGMRKNIKYYYLYYFALIFSTGLYFVFASLQNDSMVMAASSADVQFSTVFNTAGVLVITIVVIFMVYANSLFLKRRSREIGLYQLVGLTQHAVGRLLIMEHALLGAGALWIGIAGGALFSRLFVLILMKLTGIQSEVALSFSSKAAVQTIIVFAILICLTLIQTLFKVYRTTLLDLFNADRQGDQPKQPKTFLSALMGLLGIILIVLGYLLSSQTLGQHLFLQMLVILGSTILGTYLLFRVTIGWLFYRFRKGKNGQLGLNNSLSLAPMMHRMKGNASSLTLITVLSTMTLTMVAISYSLYYSAEGESRAMLPYDFIFENKEQEAKSFQEDLEKAGYSYAYQPVEAVRLVGRSLIGEGDGKEILLLTAEQLQASGADIPVPRQGEGIFYNGLRRGLSGVDTGLLPPTLDLGTPGGHLAVSLIREEDRYAMNYSVHGRQLVVSLATIRMIHEQMQLSKEYEAVRFDTYRMADQKQRAAASALYTKYISGEDFSPDFDAYYKESLRKFGLIIFIAAFLGLIFLIFTGSILYFKQMTEAEQERKSYTILRQLGFGEREIMGGIIRKQMLVFVLPLMVGLLHSIFAVKAASALSLSDLTFPAAVAMMAYTLIYFVFAVLTVGYYQRIVKAAL